MKIPSNNRWTQTNEGNIQGILRDTFNVDLETPGQLIGTKKSVAFLHEDLHTALTYALSIVYYNDNYIVVTSDEAYSFALDTTTASTIGLPSGVSVNSDAVICFDRMYVTLDTNLSYYDGSWTNSIESLTTGVPHPMEVFDSLPTFKLAIGNGNTVILVDSSGNKDSTVLTIPAQFQVTTMRYRNGYLYVGTRNIYGSEAKVFIWDGSGSNANYEVPVGASWIFSMVPYQTSVSCVTDRGQLLYINGTSATELAALPIKYAKNTRWQDHQGLQLNGKVFNRGMEVIDDSIYINIDGEVDIGECLEMKSGLWVYNPQVGLYHHAQATSDRIRTDAALSVTDSEITTTDTHYLKTGDGVVFTNLTGLTGVVENRTYYAYVTGDTTLKLAVSRAALQAGQYVTIGGSVTSETLMYAQNREYGIRRHTSGAIGRITSQELVPPLFAGQLMYGALVENLDGTNKYTVQILTDSYNVSRFSTQRIYSDNVEQTWKEYYAFIDGLSLDEEEIVLKYQTKVQEDNTVINGTWLDANTINCVSAGQDVTEISAGDELVLTDGYGRGYSTFIESIDTSTSLHSFTVSDSLGTADKPVSFFSTPTKKITTFTNSRNNTEYVHSNLNNVKSPWVMLKGEMRGFQTEITQLDLPNVKHSGTQ